MITRKDIEELRDAYRRLDGAVSELEFETKKREDWRAKLHAAHERVQSAQVYLADTRDKVAALEAKIGVGK